MTTEGSWAYGGDECFDIAICFVCSIPRSTVLTLKGTCNLGSVLQWNFYPVVNSTNQISSFDGYRGGQQIVKTNGVWLLEVQEAKISLGKNAISPIGRNKWNWFESSCQGQTSTTRNLTLSICRVGEEFTHYKPELERILTRRGILIRIAGELSWRGIYVLNKI